jgi:glycosyltransferase involved in cell wall biosynthesis
VRVLHVITGLGIGGAEQQLRLMLRHLPTEHDVVTLTNPGAVADGIRADGVSVRHLGMAGNRDLAALPRLTGLVRHGGYDLVHTHLYRACVYGRFAARLAGVRAVVATEHSLGARQIEGRPLSTGARALYLAGERLGSATVAVSDTVARRLERWGVPHERIHVVPNGIEAARFGYDAAARRATRERLGLPRDAFVVGGVGRLSRGKRFDTLVRAVADLPGAQLLLVGEGPERDALLSIARRRGAGERILLTGACEDPPATPGALSLPALLSAMDVFVSPSPDEAFGLAVVEALAAGLPVLHVTCPALHDLPSQAAPGAHQITGSVPELIDELRIHHKRFSEGPQERLPAPRAAHHYDIARSAERLMAVYTIATRGASDRS